MLKNIKWLREAIEGPNDSIFVIEGVSFGTMITTTEAPQGTNATPTIYWFQGGVKIFSQIYFQH